MVFPSPKRANGSWLRLAALAAAIAVGAISLAASAGVGRSQLALINSVPGADTTGHFFLIGGMTFFATLAFVGTNRRSQFRQWRRIVLVLVVLVSVDEIVQLLLPLRSFSFSDLLANFVGILVFSIAAWSLRRAASPGLESSVVNETGETSSSSTAE